MFHEMPTLLGLFHEKKKEENDLVKQAEERYRRTEKEKALTRTSNKAKARAEQKWTQKNEKRGKGRGPKKGGLIGSASAQAIGECAFR
jgi:hypothetical protein